MIEFEASGDECAQEHNLHRGLVLEGAGEGHGVKHGW